MGLTAAGKVFLFLTSAVLPALALRSAVRLRQEGRSPTRQQYLVSFVMSEAMTLAIAGSAARYESLDLFPAPRPGILNVLLLAAFLAPALALLRWRWSRKSPRDKTRVLWLIPHSTSDLWWWALVALTAGVVEEFVYRGVMFTLWRTVIGTAPAIAVCAAAFALVHASQGWPAAGTIALIAIAAHSIVLATGDLYTAMAAHVLYDFIAGVMVMRLARRDQLLP